MGLMELWYRDVKREIETEFFCRSLFMASNLAFYCFLFSPLLPAYLESLYWR